MTFHPWCYCTYIPPQWTHTTDRNLLFPQLLNYQLCNYINTFIFIKFYSSNHIIFLLLVINHTKCKLLLGEISMFWYWLWVNFHWGNRIVSCYWRQFMVVNIHKHFIFCFGLIFFKLVFRFQRSLTHTSFCIGGTM